jgi:ubiquinone/menaquinone biosynthesis C-methylase UbiE
MIEFNEQHLRILEQHRNTPSALAKQERFATLLAPSPGEHVLDVGCGSGTFCRMLAPLVQPGGQITGIDPSQTAISLAISLASAQGANRPHFERAAGEALPFADGSFDAASCISVLAFCEHPDRVLAEMRRVLRPGGRLLVASSDEDLRVYGGNDRRLGRAITHAIADRTRHPWIGRQLAYLIERAGLHIARERILTDFERRFQPGMAGFIFAHSMRDYLTERGGISADDYGRWIADLEQCERNGSYAYSVTTFAYLLEC